MAGSEAKLAQPRVSNSRAQHCCSGNPRVPVSAEARLFASEAARDPATLFGAAAPMQLHALERFERFEEHLCEARCHFQAVLNPFDQAILGKVPGAPRTMGAITAQHVGNLD